MDWCKLGVWIKKQEGMEDGYGQISYLTSLSNWQQGMDVGGSCNVILITEKVGGKCYPDRAEMWCFRHKWVGR